jgi:hypothetical protein
MNLSHLRSQLAQLRQSMPALVSSEVATLRHAEHLERIEAEPPGRRRDLTIRLAASHCRLVDEPAEFSEFLAALGDERLRAVFPDDPPDVEPDAGIRARARAWKEPDGCECRIARRLREQIVAEAETP